MCTLAIAMLVTSIEHVHVDGAVPSIAAWRDAGEIGKEYIEVGMGACDFPQTWAWDGHDDDESVPMRIDGAVTAEQRARFEPTALYWAKHGLEKVAVGLSARVSIARVVYCSDAFWREHQQFFLCNQQRQRQHWRFRGARGCAIFTPPLARALVQSTDMRTEEET